MNKTELLKKIVSLAPYDSDKNDDFRTILKEALQKYKDYLSKVDIVNDIDTWKSCIEKSKKHIKQINKIVTNSCMGLPSTAYAQLTNLLKSYETDKTLNWSSINNDEKFYRMRLIEDRRTNIKFNEMFHVPLNKRRIIKTHRYSIPGYPCLYLGTSIYTCWEELGRPLLNNCWTSQLTVIKKFSLLDLRIPKSEEFENNFFKYVQLFPLIIACMIPVKNSNDVYKPEYIIPQLLIEWVIKKQKDGIFYTSAHKNNEFNYLTEKSENIAIPVKSPLSKTIYCPELSQLFKISDPLNYEIEHLKSGDVTDDNYISSKNSNNYEKSSFYFLEKRLAELSEDHLHNLENSQS